MLGACSGWFVRKEKIISERTIFARAQIDVVFGDFGAFGGGYFLVVFFAALPLGVLKQMFICRFLFCRFLGVLGGFARVSGVVFFVVFVAFVFFVVCCLISAPGRAGDPMIEYPGFVSIAARCNTRASPS
jgi:hypothetical protein